MHGHRHFSHAADDLAGPFGIGYYCSAY